MAKEECPECSGTGSEPCNMDYGGDPHPDNCPVCGGDSSVRISCSFCNGTGEIDDGEPV